MIEKVAENDEHFVNAVQEVVDERTKHIVFFNRVAVQNVSEAMATKCENQHDYKSRADTILKGKETVLGKSPESAVQVNMASRSVVKMTREELLEIARG
jgi:hypothetical protein